MDNKALKFLGRAAVENSRIVSSCDLHQIAISEFQAQGRFYIDPESGLGWALVPWEISTEKDRKKDIRKHPSNEVADIAHAARRFVQAYDEFENDPSAYCEDLGALVDAVCELSDDEPLPANLPPILPPYEG